MLWLFERDEESLNLETRYNNDTSEYVVIVRYPDGRDHSERFTDSDQCRAWLGHCDRDYVTSRHERTGTSIG